MCSVNGIEQRWFVPRISQPASKVYRIGLLVERPRKVHPNLVLKDSAPDPRAPVAAKTLSDESPVTAGRSAGSGALDQKLVSAPPAPVDTQRDPSAGDRSDESFKSIFSRLKSKSEAVSRPLGNLSSFLDRLGKR